MKPLSVFQRPSWPIRNLVPLAMVASVLLQTAIALMVLFQGVQLNALLNRPAPSLVQLVDGRVLQTSPAERDYRTPEVLDKFVRDWIGLTYNWTGRLPEGSADPGVKIGRSEKVPTSTWVSSFALSESFRAAFLTGVSELVPDGVWSGDREVVVQVEAILPPKALEAGEWQVDVVSNLLLFDLEQPVGHPIANNKSILLKAVPQPSQPLDEAASPLLRAVYELRQTGLQIQQISELAS